MMVWGGWLLYCVFLIFSSMNEVILIFVLSHIRFQILSLIDNSFVLSFLVVSSSNRAKRQYRSRFRNPLLP